MPEIHGNFAYPGLEGPISLAYTCTHGISPGLILIRCFPQTNVAKLKQTGNVIIEDGSTRVVLPDCRLNTVKASLSGNGFEWTLELSDRRWKWQFGIIEGWYNQPDPRGKYVPWTLRSPLEMAELCLRAMGETRYLIDLPPGLQKADGEDYQRFLAAGELFPQTSTNPPTNWGPESPMSALARLCDVFGRRVIYNPVNDTILIARAGQGGSLPNGSIAVAGPAISSPQTPDGIMVYGSPTKYQARFKLIPVGEDWNGEYRPINQLSYTPTYIEQTKKITLTLTMPPDSDRAGLVYEVIVNVSKGVGRPPATIVSTTAVAIGMAMQQLLDAVVVSLFRPMGALCNPVNGFVFTSNAVAGTLTIEARDTDVPEFGASHGYRRTAGSSPIPPSASSRVTFLRSTRKGGKSWAYSDLEFQNAVATDRLTVTQARQLARRSIWRLFRITNIDPADDTKTVTIPGYGQIQRANQVVPLSTKVDQIQPSNGDGNIFLDRPINEPLILNLYNGLSRDIPAQLYGSVHIPAAFPDRKYIFLSRQLNLNTSKGELLPLFPSVDPNFLIVSVPVPLFFDDFGIRRDPEIVLETGCNIRNFDTNQLECYKAVRLLQNGTPTGTGYKIYRHPDVQLNVTAIYDTDNVIQTVELLEPDAQIRADYYLEAHSWEFILTEGQYLEYNGIVAVMLDGAINQVTWEVDGNGCRTKAGRNTLPPWLPSYPERRRQENLDSLQGNTPFEIGGKTLPQSLSRLMGFEDAAG